MVDADSHGMVVLLVTTALELGASLVLATEESSKAFGAIEEHAIARYMAYSAYVRRSPPKDSPYGADLLVVKGKRLDPSTIPPVEAPALEVGTLEHVADPKYYVRIYVNHADEHLVVDVVGKVSGKPLARFLGREAISLARAVVRRFDLTPEHAAYLGYELGKAELALRFGKSYEQDSETVLSPRDKLRLLKDLTKSLNTVRSMVTG
jgi:dihydropteroate synthase-like protein